MQHIGTFLLAVAGEWVAVMSGAVSLAIAIWLQITKKPWISSAVFWTIGVACMFFAFFKAWDIEHKELLKQTEANKPKFILSLGQAISWFKSEDNVTIMLIHANLLNRGADSVGVNWRAHYKSATEDKDIRVMVFADDSLQIRPPDRRIAYVVKRDELIQNKTIVAIKRGNIEIGPILVVIPGNRLDEITKGVAIITVSTDDYLGNSYSANFKGSEGVEQLDYHPRANIHIVEKESRGKQPK